MIHARRYAAHAADKPLQPVGSSSACQESGIPVVPGEAGLGEGGRHQTWKAGLSRSVRTGKRVPWAIGPLGSWEVEYVDPEGDPRERV